MELKIYNPQEDGFLQKIDWNFEELKSEITNKANDYMSLVYTPDQMKEAKKDRAALRKFIAALEDKRKEIKKQVMIPYTDFEEKEKELVSIGLKDTMKLSDKKNLKRLKRSMQKRSAV